MSKTNSVLKFRDVDVIAVSDEFEIFFFNLRNIKSLAIKIVIALG